MKTDIVKLGPCKRRQIGSIRENHVAIPKGDLAVLAGEILELEIAEEEMKRERFDYADWVPLVALIVFLLFLAFGCGARKPYAGPKWQGPWPKGVACGER